MIKQKKRPRNNNTLNSLWCRLLLTVNIFHMHYYFWSWGLNVNHYSVSYKSVFLPRFSCEWSDMMHSLLYRRFTRCTHVKCSFNNKVSADCQYSTRSCFSGMPCPCQGSKRTVKTIYAVQCVWPSLRGWGWKKWCEKTSCCGGLRMMPRRQCCC